MNPIASSALRTDYGLMDYQPDRHPFGGSPPPRRAAGPSLWQTWSNARIAGLVVALASLDFAVQIIFYAMGAGLFLPVLLGSLGGVLAPLYLLTRRLALPFRTDFSLRWPPPLMTVGAGLLAVAALSPTSLLARFSLRLHPADPTWTAFMNANLPTGPLGIALAVLTVVVVAPLAEELVFRGLLHRLVSRQWGPWAGAIISALIFGIVHGQPWYLFGLIGIGLVLALVYEATGSVLACWVTHVVHNGISLVMMLVGDQANDSITPITTTDWLLAAGSLVCLALLGAYLLRIGHTGRRRRPFRTP